MKLLVVFAFALLASGAFASPVGIPFFGSHTYYLPQDLLGVYPYSPLAPTGLPFVNEDQLCFLVGAISGCSGCSLGTQGLCRWIQNEQLVAAGPGIRIPVPFQTCVAKDFARELIAQGDVNLGPTTTFSFTDATTICPADPKKDPVIRSPLLAASEGRIIPIEEVSLIHNTFHDMRFGDVPVRPWAVDRTSLYGAAGAMRLGGSGIYARGAFGGLYSTCAEINDEEEFLDGDETPLVNYILQGAIISP